MCITTKDLIFAKEENKEIKILSLYLYHLREIIILEKS